MFIDLTLTITPQLRTDAAGNEKKTLTGHLGTHFDVMKQSFPLAYLERKAIVFDVSAVKDREIEAEDIDLKKVSEDMFVAFYTGFIEKEGYATERYFKEHPVLSLALIKTLVAQQISIIGIDFAGVRRGAEHTPTDQFCAERGVFIVENLCQLKALLKDQKDASFIANTYPVKYEGMTGLPCRVVAKV
ncbi:MAG TPA: cyclase family protein [Clostridiales bacterium]|nr:cyclase family protein [Clostridiales bacterium]